jgi:hypothetical protein
MDHSIPTNDDAKIIVDEDWKSKVEAEKEAIKHPSDETSAPSSAAEKPSPLGQIPPATFGELVSMLATQAGIELGQGADAQADGGHEHFAIGKHFIDLLGVLEAKTKGNVTADEAKMLDAVLHDLRMAYIRLKP